MSWCSLRGLLLPFVLVLGIIGLSGCRKSARPYGEYDRNAQAYYEHVVKYPGETLGVLAKWYTGSTANWSIIAQENPQVDPRRIRSGMLIRIPRRLMIREKPYSPQAADGRRSNKVGAQTNTESDSGSEKRDTTREEVGNSQQDSSYSPPTEEPTPEPTVEPTPEETPVEETPTPTPEPTQAVVVPEATPVQVTPKEDKNNSAKKNREEILRELMDEY